MPTETPIWKIPHNITIQRASKWNKEKTATRQDTDLLDKKYPQNRWIKVYTDGSVTGTHRHGGVGIVIERGKEIIEISQPIGINCSPSVAEGKVIIRKH